MESLEVILRDHAEHPRCKGLPKSPHWSAKDKDARTQDAVELGFVVGGGVVVQAGFEAWGSAVLHASCSLLCEASVGKDAEACMELARHAIVFLQGMPKVCDVSWAVHGDIACLSLIAQYPARVACASLPWRTWLHCLKDRLNAEQVDSV